MSNTTHTPGPWAVGEELPDGFIPVQGKFLPIAKVCEKTDAHLIAAAPELLAYAECAEAYDRRYESPSNLHELLKQHGWDGTCGRLGFIADLRRAAIAKARGQK